MKRYSILFMVAFVAGLFMLPACTQGQKKTEATEEVKPKKDIYLQLYSVRDDIKANYQATIDTVAAIGYTGVEAAGYADGQFYGMSPADFKKSIEDKGMVVLSSHAGRPLAENVKDTNWDEVWAWWDTAIQAHKDAGMKFLVLPWIPAPKTMDDVKAYADYFNKIGEKCNAAGIQFGYHNHNFEFKEIDGQMIYDYLLQNTDPEKVFFQMDVYWVGEGGQDPVAYFEKYSGRFKILHIKDELELGKSGKVNFENIFNNIDKSGAKYLVVEVERYTTTPFAGIRESYDYLANAPFVKDSYSK